jgi:hypothetical protein
MQWRGFGEYTLYIWVKIIIYAIGGGLAYYSHMKVQYPE